jgi:lysophospholipase L1-like esterase
MRHNRWLKGSVLGLIVCLTCWIGSAGQGISTPVMNSQSPQIASNSNPVNQAPPKVVFLGSSTTVGLWASRGDRRWSTLLSRYLGWQEINESLSGSSLSKAPRTDKSWPIPAAVQRWQEIVARHPDRIVMLYGANDAFWKLPLGDEVNPKPETFRGDLETLLKGIKTALPPDHLVVVTPQPNQATQERRSPYDQALQGGAEKIGAHFIDAGRNAFPVEELASYSADGLHLNNLGHAAFASYMAGKLVDLGVAPPPPMAKGGHQLPQARETLSGGWLRIDAATLSFGEIRKISARWIASGRARFAVMRPDGRGGYEALYRTPIFPVSAGIMETKVPRWWVLEGDRLAVWTDSNCLGSQSDDAGSIHHLTSKLQGDTMIPDVRPNSTISDSRKLAVWTS